MRESFKPVGESNPPTPLGQDITSGGGGEGKQCEQLETVKFEGLS